jgi:hypothetical protein
MHEGEAFGINAATGLFENLVVTFAIKTNISAFDTLPTNSHTPAGEECLT